MIKRRSNKAIITQVLEVCRAGSNRAQVISRADLNSQSADLYLDLLVKNELIEMINAQGTIYRTAPKGLEVLDRLNALAKLIPDNEIWY
jgi:predicted transcriptional regulator